MPLLSLCGKVEAIRAPEFRGVEPMADLYELLGVSRQASEREIKAAYRRLAKRYHPDVNPSPTAAEDFARITEAYKVLSNRRLRDLYDRGLLADYEAYLRQRERAAVLRERLKDIVQELLRREREEAAIRQTAVMLVVSLFASAFLVALFRPPIFEMLGPVGKAVCLGLFGVGMWELVRDVMMCLDYYTYPDDVTPSFWHIEEEMRGKPFSRTTALAFLVGGYLLALVLGSLVRYALVGSDGRLLLSYGLINLILLPPIAVLILMRLRALSERLSDSRWSEGGEW